MTFANTRQNKKRPKPISKAEVFAKAHSQTKTLKPRPLWLQFDDYDTAGHRNSHGVHFEVSETGQMEVQDWTFTAKDALRLARWLEENFR